MPCSRPRRADRRRPAAHGVSPARSPRAADADQPAAALGAGPGRHHRPRRRRNDAEHRVRNTLLAGGNTAEIRAELAALWAEQERAAAARVKAAAEAQAERDRLVRERVEVTAAGYA